MLRLRRPSRLPTLLINLTEHYLEHLNFDAIQYLLLCVRRVHKVKFMTLWNDFCPVSVIRQRRNE